jgi:hypothetical protein
MLQPEHWLDMRSFKMAFAPKNMTADQAEAEIDRAWSRSYEPRAIASALDKMGSQPYKDRAVMLFARLAFRGIYFPQMRRRDWLRVIVGNRGNLFRVVTEARAEYSRRRDG